jgi:geranylgeranyl reductase family protein
MIFDVAIVGGGPAGSVCAAVCAQAGLKTLLLERAQFPRDKVCGDCLNPAAWPVLEQLGVADRVAGLTHTALKRVEFIDRSGGVLSVPLPPKGPGEIAVRRSHFDHLLLERARELGAIVLQEHPLLRIESREPWRLQTPNGHFDAKTLVAADGRNSTVARLCGVLKSAPPDRIGMQVHVSRPEGFDDKVTLQFRPEGYCGMAAVGAETINVCLVAKPKNMPALKAWANQELSLDAAQEWRSISPLARAAIPPRHGTLLLVGDAARVVEPFTGEGITYALRSGELAGRCIVSGNLDLYPQAHRALYRGKLWINDLSRLAATRPALGDTILRLGRIAPGLLGFLTRKVIAPAR